MSVKFIAGLMMLMPPGFLLAEISKPTFDLEQKKIRFSAEAKADEKDGPSWKAAELRAWEAGVQGIISKAPELFKEQQPTVKLKEPKDLARDVAQAVNSRKTTYVKGGIVRIAFDVPIEAFTQ